MAKITVIPLFLNKSLSAGDSATSNPIDLRYCSSKQNFSIAHGNAAGTSTTCGTTVFSYTGSPEEFGTYVLPVGGSSAGTSGPAIAARITSFTPAALIPFIKIIATQSGAGTAGANSVVSAQLIVQ